MTGVCVCVCVCVCVGGGGCFWEFYGLGLCVPRTRTVPKKMGGQMLVGEVGSFFRIFCCCHGYVRGVGMYAPRRIARILLELIILYTLDEIICILYAY